MDDHFVESKDAAAMPNGNTNGSRTQTKKDPPSVISGQLRDELIRILTTGDAENAGAFTIGIAAQVEKFAVAAREILMTENLAKNDLATLMMMRRRHHLGGGPFPLVGGAIVGDDGLLPLPSPIVNNENFGVQAIRQLVDAMRTKDESPVKLVEALAVARKHGLTDVVAVLETKLGISSKAPEGESPEGTAS